MQSKNILFSDFERIFPFCFITDNSGKLIHIGPSLKKISTRAIEGVFFNEIFQFVRPEIVAQDFFNENLQGEMIVIQELSHSFSLMGQLLYDKNSGNCTFVVSLAVQEPHQVNQLKLTFNDFAIQDQVFDFLMLIQTQRRATREAEELNIKLTQAHKVAVEAAHAKSNFLANFSHELLTPMNGVLGIASILDRTHLDSTQKEYVATIIESAESMLSMIHNILDFTKLTSESMELDFFSFDTQQVFLQTMQMAQISASKKKLDFNFLIAESIPKQLKGDSLRLQQILNHLISNAIKFTDSGFVHIDVQLAEQTESKATLSVYVRDSGIGMSEQMLGAIGEPYSQGDNSMTKKYQGNGLGLALSKKLICCMGGEIHFKSELGKGTEINFTAVFAKDEKMSASY